MSEITIKQVNTYRDLPPARHNKHAVYQVKGLGGVIYRSDGEFWVRITDLARPMAFTSTALQSHNDGATMICATAQTATVPTGLQSGFGMSFKGAISFTAASGVTLNDLRTSGATNPWCALVQIGTDTYDILGTKA